MLKVKLDDLTVGSSDAPKTDKAVAEVKTETVPAAETKTEAAPAESQTEASQVPEVKTDADAKEPETEKVPDSESKAE